MGQMQFLSPIPEGHEFFLNFIILMDSHYDSGENKVLFEKIGARVPDLCLDTCFGSKLY